MSGKGRRRSFAWTGFPFRLAETSIYGALTLLPLAFWPGSFEMFGAPKALLLRGLTALALAAWAAGSVLRGRFRIYPSPLYLPMGAFLGINLVATIQSVSPRLSWLGEHYRNDAVRLLTQVINENRSLLIFR